MHKRPIIQNNDHLCRVREEANAGRHLFGAWDRQVIFDALTDGILILGNDLRVRQCNKAAERLFGKKTHELIGKYCWELIPFGVLQSTHRKSNASCPCLTRQKIEAQIGTRWIEMSIDPLTGPNGECFGAAHILRDITRQKETDEDLYRREQRLRFLVSSTPAVIYTCKPFGDYATTFISENVRIHFGHTAERFLNEPDFWRQHIHPDDQARVFAQLPDLIGQNLQAFEYRFKAKNGRWLWVHDEARVIKDAQGAPLEIIGYFVDITERKKAQVALLRANTELEERVIKKTAQLTEAQRRLRSFLDNSDVVAWMKDEQGRYIFLSENFQKRFKVRFEQWNGKTDFDLWPRANAERFRHDDLAVLRRDRSAEFVEPAPDPGGGVSWWSTTKFIFRDSAGNRYVGGLGVEITRRKQAEEAAREMHEKLVRAHEQLKTEAAETIALREAVVGAGERERERIGQDLHDGLCQFLTAIRLKADLVERRLAEKNHPETGSVQELIQLLKQAVDQTRSLAQGLQPVEQVPEGLTIALHQLAASMKLLFNLTCRCHISSLICITNHRVAVDLFYIAHEAVTNAIKHAQTRSVYISLTRRGKRIVLRVTNGGKNFDGQGRDGGLGLKTMRYRAGRIGARLTIKPRPGGGTLLTCSIPIAQTKAGNTKSS